MPDDARTQQQIELRMDRGVHNTLEMAGTGGAMSIAPRNMTELIEFAKLMAVSGPCIRKQFRGNTGACLAISLQAFKFGGDPFAFSNKAYLVNDQLAWEAQLIHSIVNTSGVLQRRLRPVYSGEGVNRSCKISGWVKGEDEPLEYESPPVGKIAVKNSPLWTGDPDQQLFYFSSRSWARRHCPEVILGMYTPEEIQGEIIDMTPQHGAVQEAETAAEPVPWEVCDAEGEVYKFERSNSAIEACRKILIASAADPAKLATAWENNAGFILSLGQEGLEPEAQGIERLYAELMPQPQPETETVVGDLSAASAARVVPGVKDNENPVARETEQQEVDRHTETATQAWEQDERNAPENGGGSPPFAQTGTEPEPMAASNATTGEAPVPSQAGTGRTATTVASPSERPVIGYARTTPPGMHPDEQRPPQPSTDPFWKRPSLKIDPPPVRGGGSLSKLEWKSWPALMLPRIRQVWTKDLLNRLYQDNRDLLDVFESACGTRERNELDAAFDDARARLS